MKESDAKKTICPEMSGYVSAGVEGQVDFYTVYCCGSGCQWWVWDIVTEGDQDIHRKYGHCGAIKYD